MHICIYIYIFPKQLCCQVPLYIVSAERVCACPDPIAKSVWGGVCGHELVDPARGPRGLVSALWGGARGPELVDPARGPGALVSACPAPKSLWG